MNGLNGRLAILVIESVNACDGNVTQICSFSSRVMKKSNVYLKALKTKRRTHSSTTF